MAMSRSTPWWVQVRRLALAGDIYRLLRTVLLVGLGRRDARWRSGHGDARGVAPDRPRYYYSTREPALLTWAREERRCSGMARRPAPVIHQ